MMIASIQIFNQWAMTQQGAETRNLHDNIEYSLVFQTIENTVQTRDAIQARWKEVQRTLNQ